MKWHIVCLIVISWSLIYPIKMFNSSVTVPASPGDLSTVTVQVSGHDATYLFLWTQWQVVTWLYSACPGRLTLCRWRLIRWRSRSARRKKRRPGQPASSPDERCPASALKKTVPLPQAARPSSTDTKAGQSDDLSPPDGKGKRISLRMALRPGVILTQRGLQLRPMIARLGKDAGEYHALWGDKAQFKAAIAPLLRQPCPSCKGKQGFRRIGSDKRSVIPTGSKKREWFRVQKVECKNCGAITRILPTFCLPFKSHHAQTIQACTERMRT